MGLLHYLIQNDFASLLITIWLFFYILGNRELGKRLDRLYFAILPLLFVSIVSEGLGYWLAQRAELPGWRIAAVTISYAVKPFIVSLMIGIVMSFRYMMLCSIPAFANLALCLVNLFYPILFGIGADAKPFSGPLRLLPCVVSCFYLAVLAIIAINSFRKNDYIQIGAVLMVSSICIAAAVMEISMGFHGILNDAFAFSLSFFYLFMHSQTSKRDDLTGALDRKAFYLDFDSRYNSVTGLISLDFNGLKQLNDTMGHAAGDEGLKAMAYSINKELPPSCTLYRVGGDEFSIICLKMTHSAMEALVTVIKNSMSKTGYTCAAGLAFKNGRESIDYLCAIADRRMYQDKKQQTKGMIGE